ncbi:hypothetical protein OEZ85_004913 [Tetradesmus obliquus]|uniref:Uncharacterized protein n=1 Tax=Tetradesmus obliquus TaxID=3088 RepID=A0ABY8UH03_TETOB|nr:hypothetical protein OEZ85_004913 [Tetradesmus obliquus]
MGKTRGHGSRRGAYRGSKGRGKEDEDSEEEIEPQRGLGGQRSNVGMLPPSDSGSDEEGEEGKEGEAADKQKQKASSSKGGQSKTAGKLPPSGSEDDEDEDESSEEESSEEPLNEYLASAPRKKKVVEEEPDPEQIRKDMERLELIKQKREQDRLKRIADEGWDRFAPISDTNKPPGHVPSDHPSNKE